MQTLRDRLILFMAHNQLSHAKFAHESSLSRGFMSTVKDNLTANTQIKISAAFPELNINWLLTGEGEMLKNTLGTIAGNANNSDISELNKTEENMTDISKLIAVLSNRDKQLDKLLDQNDKLINIIENLSKAPSSLEKKQETA